MGNGIRRLRKEAGIDPATLAAKLEISRTYLSRYERDWEPLPTSLVKDLAVLFECSASEILGREIPVEEWQGSPYAAGDLKAEQRQPYGNFGFEIAGQPFSFPVSEKTRLGLLHQMQEQMVGNAESERRPWITCGTLNNQSLYINPTAVRRLWLRGDDDQATEYFAHPEVYRAAYDWESDKDLGPVLLKNVTTHFKAIGEERAVEETQRVRLFGFDGKETEDELYLSDDWVVTSIHALDAHSFHVEPQAFVLLDSSGYYVSEFMNLSHVGFMQVPLELYLRRSAPEELAANDDG